MENACFQPTNLGVYNYGRPRFWRRQFGDAPTRATDRAVRSPVWRATARLRGLLSRRACAIDG